MKSTSDRTLNRTWQIARLACTLTFSPCLVAAETQEPLKQQPNEARAEVIIEAATPVEESWRSLRDDIREAIRGRLKDKSVIRHQAIVRTGNITVSSNEVVETVVCIGGNVVIDGAVREAVVCVGGNVQINGLVGDDVVCVGGNVNLNSMARVGGEVVPIGGNFSREAGARIWREPEFPNISLGALPFLPQEGLQNWIRECVFLARPLSFGVTWMWWLTGAMFLVYLLVALLFARPVAACVGRLEQQPVSTFFVGILAKVMVPLILGVLIITGVGLLAVPFLLVALVLGQLIGKVALCEFLGRQCGRQLKTVLFERPLLAFLCGWVFITALYLVPVLGLVTLGLVSIWGLGVATATAFGGARRERPTRPIAAPVAATAPTSAPSVVSVASASTFPANPAASSPLPPTINQVLPPLYAPASAASVFPAYAGFWPRLGAGALDLILLCLIASFSQLGAFFPLIAVTYFTGMIAWRGTTIGGVIANLKVMRLDGQPVTWVVALVRALGACLSTVVLMLGFFWIAWDPERQSWHDKIAGTVVLRASRSQPLV